MVPAAGRGTRLYPLTKIQPKEMMAVGHRPVIQAVVEELAAAGIGDILVIVGPDKSVLETHLDPNIGRLSESEREPWAQEFADADVRIHFTQQDPPRGLGDAVACAEQFVGEDDFAVALGDSVMMGGDEDFMGRLLQVHEANRAAATLGVQHIQPEQSSRHGVIAVARTEGNVLQVSGVVEKPHPDQAPSSLAICGRYVLSPAIFAHLHDLDGGYGGEIQVTDAIGGLVEAGELVQAVVLGPEELRLDVGNFASYSRAFVRAMVAHPQLGAEFREYLRRLAAHLDDSSRPDPDQMAAGLQSNQEIGKTQTRQ